MQCMFHLYSKPDGALAQKVLEVTTCKNPANAVAKLNTNKSEDSKHMIATVWFVCFLSHLQVIKKHPILNTAVQIDVAFIRL